MELHFQMKPSKKEIGKSKTKNGVNIHHRKPKNDTAIHVTKYKNKREVAKEKQHQMNQEKAEKSRKAKSEESRLQLGKEDRIRAYKKKRLQKTKALCKKTNLGQPLMKDRMELLLKEIQEMRKYPN